jgi:hypothetical protein
VCGADFIKGEVQVPVKDEVAAGYSAAEVNLPEPEAPDQVRLFIELQRPCTSCGHNIKQFVPVEK